MGAMIQFLDTSASNSCKKAVAPIVFQDTQALIAGDGAAPIIPAGLPVAAGDPANYGGQVVVQGCYDAEITITYLEGDDCDACTTPDTLTPVTITVVAPANSSFPLPDGFWHELEFVLVDAAGAPVALAGDATETVRFYACYTPECPGCAVQVPDGE